MVIHPSSVLRTFSKSSLSSCFGSLDDRLLPYFPTHILREFHQIFSALEDMALEERNHKLIQVLFVYLWEVNGIDRVKIVELIQKLPRKMSEVTKTTYQQIVEYGEKLGEERGEIRGETRKENQIIKQGIKEGLSLELIAKLTGISMEEVKKRIQELGLDS
ncbi:MAG: hypothetical protein AAF694_22200 [Bacteroidota bacterium]